MHTLLLCLPITQPIVRDSAQPADRLFAVELHMPETAPAHTITEPTPPALQPQKKAAPAQARPANPPAPPEKPREHEATVSLDRMSDADVQYRSYLAHLRSKISAAWHYPQEARDRGLSGIATVRFSITRNGGLSSVIIKHPSGHLLLDDESLRTIRAAAPFQPFPREFSIETLHVTASFEYEVSRH